MYLFLADAGVSEDDRPRMYREHRDALTALNDEQFIAKFRLCKDAVRELCEAVAPDLQKREWRFLKFQQERFRHLPFCDVNYE